MDRETLPDGLTDAGLSTYQAEAYVTLFELWTTDGRCSVGGAHNSKTSRLVASRSMESNGSCDSRTRGNELLFCRIDWRSIETRVTSRSGGRPGSTDR